MTRSLELWRCHHKSAFAGAKVLVTGGAGFIGSHLASALAHLGAAVVALDDLSGGGDGNFDSLGPALSERSESKGIEFVRGSILDVPLLERCVSDCRYVFHQAALGSVPGSVKEPRRYFEVNVAGTINVLEAARAAGVRRLMFAASASAYGSSEVLPKVETMEPQPISPYAASKVAGEAFLRAYSASYPGLDTVAMRYFNIFGPRQNANSAYAAAIAAFATAVLAGRTPTIFGDGEQSRDFTHVDNVVHANLLAARSESPLRGEVINVAVGQRVTVNALVREVIAFSGKPGLSAAYVPERAGDVRHSLADVTRGRQLLGYEPIVDFRTGLTETLEWYAKQPRTN